MHSKLIALLGGALSLGLVNAASAADMAVKARPAPVAAVVYNWTGFYIGADVGGAWTTGDAFTSFTEPAGGGVGIGAFNQGRGLSSSSFIGGVYAGYNWQAANWVLGVEADISGLVNSNTSATAPNLTFPGGLPLAGGFNFSRGQDWLSTVRGRIGYLISPTTLLYVAGGAAFGENHYAATYTEAGGGVWQTNFRKTQVGYTVGGGAEFMFSQNWLLRAEYLYVSLPGATSVTTSPAFAPTFVVPFNWNRTDEHIGRVGIAYKFGGPVVARY
jgi:outer membrane immunogenic protein